MVCDYDKEFFVNFEHFLNSIGRYDLIPYMDAMVVCDGDKTHQYKQYWVKHNVPFKYGCMLYFISKYYPFTEEARVKMSVESFVVKYYKIYKDVF